jgi:hypothetical protein
MLYNKIKKYLSDNSININDVFTENIELMDLNNGSFISKWDSEKIGIEQPTQAQLDNINNEELILEEKIEYQLQQLDNYHYNSSEIREIKINDYFILSLSGDGRALIAEQIQSLDQQVKLNIITEESATFEYFYNGGSIEITLVQLRQLYIFMLNVVNTNYAVYKAHVHEIKNLSTIEKVESYDFTANYLKNQNLNV